MEEITRGDIIDKGLSPSTVNKIIGILRIILNEAFLREEIDRNPPQSGLEPCRTETA